MLVYLRRRKYQSVNQSGKRPKMTLIQRKRSIAFLSHFESSVLVYNVLLFSEVFYQSA